MWPQNGPWPPKWPYVFVAPKWPLRFFPPTFSFKTALIPSYVCILFSNAMNFTHDDQSVDYDFTSEDVLILNKLQITTVAICLSVTNKAKILFPEKKNQNMANSFHLRLNHKRKKGKTIKPTVWTGIYRCNYHRKECKKKK